MAQLGFGKFKIVEISYIVVKFVIFSLNWEYKTLIFILVNINLFIFSFKILEFVIM